MATAKRTTVYLDSDLLRALKLRAAATDRSVSEMVNDALRRDLSEDAEDLEAHAKRKGERSLDFETFVKSLRRRGKL
jgi:plasmid stability protein